MNRTIDELDGVYQALHRARGRRRVAGIAAFLNFPRHPSAGELAEVGMIVAGQFRQRQSGLGGWGMGVVHATPFGAMFP